MAELAGIATEKGAANSTVGNGAGWAADSLFALIDRRGNTTALAPAMASVSLLVCDDLDAQWWVEAHGAETEISNAGTRADSVLRGAAIDLMALLLGRQTPSMLAVAGDTTRAQRFKRAFPGP